MKHYYVFMSSELLIQREYSFVTTFICHDTFPEGKHIQIGCDAALCVWKGERTMGGKWVPENYLDYFDFYFSEERLDNFLERFECPLLVLSIVYLVFKI